VTRLQGCNPRADGMMVTGHWRSRLWIPFVVMTATLVAACGSTSAVRTSSGNAPPPTAAGPNSPNYQQPIAIPADVPPFSLPADLQLASEIDCRHISTTRPADVRTSYAEFCRAAGVAGVGILAD